MSWYDTEGQDPIYTLFSQTRYSRNLASLPFIGKTDNKSWTSFTSAADTLLTKNGFRKEVCDNDIIQLSALAEKGFIDRDFIDSQSPRALYFNEPCSLAVSLGGRDHINIRSLVSGKISESRNIASGAEELLDKNFEFAYTEKLGYVSALPHLCGSGVEFSSLLYLPSLRIKDRRDVLQQKINQHGAALSSAFIYPNCRHDLYLLSSSPSPYCEERAAAESFDTLIENIIEEERAQDRIIFAEKSKIIIEDAHRALGILLYARRLSACEMLSFSSDIRLSLALGEGDVPEFSALTLNTLLGKGLDFSVLANIKGECPDSDSLDEYRARLITELLS